MPSRTSAGIPTTPKFCDALELYVDLVAEVTALGGERRRPRPVAGPKQGGSSCGAVLLRQTPELRRCFVKLERAARSLLYPITSPTQRRRLIATRDRAVSAIAS